MNTFVFYEKDEIKIICTRCEIMLRDGDIAPRILNLDIRWR